MIEVDVIQVQQGKDSGIRACAGQRGAQVSRMKFGGQGPGDQPADPLVEGGLMQGLSVMQAQSFLQMLSARTGGFAWFPRMSNAFPTFVRVTTPQPDPRGACSDPFRAVPSPPASFLRLAFSPSRARYVSLFYRSKSGRPGCGTSARNPSIRPVADAPGSLPPDTCIARNLHLRGDSSPRHTPPLYLLSRPSVSLTDGLRPVRPPAANSVYTESVDAPPCLEGTGGVSKVSAPFVWILESVYWWPSLASTDMIAAPR
jgi:hypothetical protein